MKNNNATSFMLGKSVVADTSIRFSKKTAGRRAWYILALTKKTRSRKARKYRKAFTSSKKGLQVFKNRNTSSMRL